MCNKALASSRDASANNKGSSANSISVITGAYRDTLMPWKRPQAYAKDNKYERVNKNKYGDWGSPYLIPWEGIKGEEGTSLIKIEKLTVNMHSKIICIYYVEKPILRSTICKKHRSTWS